MNRINAVGKPCPLPVIEAKRALRGAPAGSQVEILVDNDIARQNLQKMAEGMGCSFAYMPHEGNILVTLTASQSPGEALVPSDDLVVAIGSECMGTGADELGRMLMKSFIYSLTELDAPPRQLLFFNGGIQLTTQGAATLADLETLVQKGADIATCGACLDYYSLRERLAIGSITNMYAIASAMAEAGRLIQL